MKQVFVDDFLHKKIFFIAPHHVDGEEDLCSKKCLDILSVEYFIFMQFSSYNFFVSRLNIKLHNTLEFVGMQETKNGTHS